MRSSGGLESKTMSKGTIHVTGGWYGLEHGSHRFPYNAVSEDDAAVPAGERLRSKGGSYTEAGSLNVTLPR